MDRCTGILKVPVYPNGNTLCRVAASLCISPSSKSLLVPTANAIFFNGDKVEGTGNPVIERLSDLQNIAKILVSKFGASINAWVIEAPIFNGPFAVYKEFLPSLSNWGEPYYYKHDGFPASTSVVSLLSSFLHERAENSTQEEHHHPTPSVSTCFPRTFILGFSKVGVVLNQLVTELGFVDIKCMEGPAQADLQSQIIPRSRESFLDSITEIHYVDVGLNTPGAYLTDHNVIERIAGRLIQRDGHLCFMLHGTPRQWNDKRRAWICDEKDQFCQVLEAKRLKCMGKLQVCERVYFADKNPDMQMHFEIIEELILFIDARHRLTLDIHV